MSGDLMPPRSPQVPMQVAQSAPAERHLPPQIVFAAEPRYTSERHRKKSSSASVASWILLVFACAGAMLPVAGFGMWLIIGPILLITLVLGIVAITQGNTVSGVMIILASLIVVPLFVLLAPFFMTGLALGAAGASGSAFDGGHRTTSQESVVAAPVEQVAWQEEETEPSLPAMDVAPQGRPLESTNHDSSSQPFEASRPENREVRSNSAPQAYGDEFTHKAILVDSRGTIVLQSGPSILSANVDKLQSGDSVFTAGRDGKWIKVRTNNGLVGYVRQKQLQFQFQPGQ
ncbi:SH3 domain-containing protein [Luteimonas mephitis]|uniref:SH3 domain-containing protein n=2 Tax=Luteimonas mephitis TaxID=83615 RepID=UPI001FDEB6E3|nr:hypothetical protein [Luteimonas mephitis]